MEGPPVNRRDFIARTGLAAAGLTVARSLAASQGAAAAPKKAGRFRLKYAPSIGQFKNLAGADIAGQIQFVADQGFTALFDNGIMGRPASEQDLIVRQCSRLGLAMGPFVLYAEFSTRSFVKRDAETRTMLLQKMQQGIDTMARTGIKQALVVPGRYDESLAWDYQTANVIDNLRACAEVCAPKGLVIVLEPLNPKNHPGLFLTKIPQAFAICRAVNSPSCKILNDMYHQQITEGNLIPNIEAAWSEIAAFHIGDNPGRWEPTSGEINYRNIFKWIHAKGYEGVLCMEHGQSKPGKDGEQAVIDAYRECDRF
jgi:hydroxypyruvate isomerase